MHAMNHVHASSDFSLWINQSVKDYAALLIDYTDLAHDTCVVTLVHLAVDCYEQRKVVCISAQRTNFKSELK